MDDFLAHIAQFGALQNVRETLVGETNAAAEAIIDCDHARTRIIAKSAAVRESNRLRGPFCAEELCLCKDELGCFVLQVWRVAVLSEDAFDHHAHLSPSAFAQGPVDRHAFADLGDQFGGDDL